MRLEDDASDGKGRKRREGGGKRNRSETRRGETIERTGGIERDEKTDGTSGARSLYLSCRSYPRRSVSYPRLALNPGCASPNETVVVASSRLDAALYQANLDVHSMHPPLRDVKQVSAALPIITIVL